MLSGYHKEKLTCSRNALEELGMQSMGEDTQNLRSNGH